MSIFARLRGGITTASTLQTHLLAEEFAQALPADVTLALHGDLGVGKTTFVQGLARGFGIHQSVTSPTFTIFNLYRSDRRTLVHLDAYRLEGENRIESLMLDDFLVSPYCLAVEWPERIPDALSIDTFHLQLTIEGENLHRIKLVEKYFNDAPA